MANNSTAVALAAEVAERAASILSSHDDDEELTQAEAEVIALEDIVAMGDDCGGAYRQGIAPAVADAALRAKYAEHAAKMKAEHAEWKALRQAARRELKKRVDAE